MKCRESRIIPTHVARIGIAPAGCCLTIWNHHGPGWGVEAVRLEKPPSSSVFAVDTHRGSSAYKPAGAARGGMRGLWWLSGRIASPWYFFRSEDARGCSSVGRASAFQADSRGFDPRRPLHLVFLPVAPPGVETGLLIRTCWVRAPDWQPIRSHRRSGAALSMLQSEFESRWDRQTMPRTLEVDRSYTAVG